jgi:hypothetical protein
MIGAHRQEIGRTLLPLVLLVLLVQAVAPAVMLVGATRSIAGPGVGSLGAGTICQIAADDLGGPLEGRPDHHEACPMCSLRIDVALPAPLPAGPVERFAGATVSWLHPAYGLAAPRAPPPDPVQPRAPPSIS